MKGGRTKTAPPAAGPRTVVGSWLRANIVQDIRLRDQLLYRLNNGKPGWNRDEAGFIQAVCDLAVHKYFGAEYDVRAVTKFVSFLREADRAGGKTPPGQLEMEAIIRHSLGEAGVDVQGINAALAFKVQAGVTAAVVLKLDFTESQVDELITEAEQLAIARGWNPPLAA